MSVCPKCNTNIDEDFGLVDCTGCGVAVLIGIDGDVKVASENNEAPPAIPSEITSPTQEVYGDTGFAGNVAELNDEATSFSFNTEENSLDGVTDDQFGFSEEVNGTSVNEYAVGEFESFEAEQSEELATNSQAIIDEFTSFGEALPEDDQLPQEQLTSSIEQFESTNVYEEVVEELNDEKTNFLAESEIAKAKKPEPQTSLVNLSDYANSKKSSLKDGYLKYKLYIGGIDTNEIKAQVFEELADKKLLLDLSELNKKIVDGNLCIEPISAVKASILVNRLKSISVTIAWDQYDIRKA